MNYIDIVLIIPLLWGAWKGFTKGLVIEVVTLVALVLGVWGGIHFSDYMAEVLTNNFTMEERYLPIVSFAITFILIVAAAFALGKLLEKVIDLVALGVVNKVAGGAFGVVKVGLIISVLLVIVNSYDQRLHFIPDELKQESLLFQPMTDVALTVVPALQESKLYDEVEGAANDTDSTLTANTVILPE